MSVSLEDLVKAIEDAKKASVKRRFTQSLELIITYSDLDLKKLGRINEVIQLPHPFGRLSKVCVIADGDVALKAKQLADGLVDKDCLNKCLNDKKYARNIAKSYDFFIAQADLMPLVGRALGPFLGPRGKMPILLPSISVLEALVDRLRKSTRVRMKDQPVVQAFIGYEDEDSGKIAENAKTIIDGMKERLKVPHKVKNIYVKTTMGPLIRVL
ncbi:MAG: 50S ribosomal protein L1 [Candidatus Nezhaarchaeales archaeon]